MDTKIQNYESWILWTKKGGLGQCVICCHNYHLSKKGFFLLQSSHEDDLIYFFSYTDVVNLLLCSSHTLIFWRFIIMIALFKGNWDKEGGASPSAELRLLTAAGQPEPQSQRFGIGPQRSNSPAASSNFLLDILFSNKIWLRNGTLNHAIFFPSYSEKISSENQVKFCFWI